MAARSSTVRIIILANKVKELAVKNAALEAKVAQEVHFNVLREELKDRMKEQNRCSEVRLFDQIRDLKTQVAELKEKREEPGATRRIAGTCAICFDAPANHIVTPCGHLCACGACLPKCERCPICRGPMESVQRVFMCGGKGGGSGLFTRAMSDDS